MFWYPIASLSPVAIFFAAGLLGGGWAWVALIWVTLLVFAVDRLGVVLPLREDAGAARMARRLTVVLALVHLGLLGFAVVVLADGDFTATQRIALFIAFGIYFGQVANSNAHDLIHASGRWARRLGGAVYVALLFGHHVSAHRLVHHVAVASDGDPNSARPGEGFYHFWPRAWVGSFRAGWQAENRLRARAAHPSPVWTHPYVAYAGGALATLALAWALAGGRGVLALVALAGYAQTLQLLADYVQHFGLHRTRRADGTLTPAGPEHSWNAAPWYSAAMMLNAPRHSDHHQHPSRAFPALRLDPETMPILPSTLPAMAALALAPPLWRRVMDGHVNRVVKARR